MARSRIVCKYLFVASLLCTITWCPAVNNVIGFLHGTGNGLEFPPLQYELQISQCFLNDLSGRTIRPSHLRPSGPSILQSLPVSMRSLNILQGSLRLSSPPHTSILPCGSDTFPSVAGGSKQAVWSGHYYHHPHPGLHRANPRPPC